MSTNEKLLDEAIRHAIHAERFGKGLARRISALLDAVDGDIAGLIADRLARVDPSAGPATTRRLNDLLVSLRNVNDRVYGKVGKELQAELTTFAEYEANYQAENLEASTSIDYKAALPPATVLKELVTNSPIDGFLLSSWVDNMSRNRLARIEQQLRIGIVEGETIDQIVGRIRGTKAKRYTDGVLAISRKSAQSLAITSVSTVSNNARLEVFKANTKLIKALQWVSTLDSRTSPVCQSRDGKTYEIDKPHPRPPAHVRCRSLLVPVTKSFAEMGLDAKEYSPDARASMDGQVAGNQKFGGWLKKQPRERVEDIMGKERAELYLSGKVPFERFFNEDDQYYTLAELRRREKR